MTWPRHTPDLYTDTKWHLLRNTRAWHHFLPQVNWLTINSISHTLFVALPIMSMTCSTRWCQQCKKETSRCESSPFKVCQKTYNYYVWVDRRGDELQRSVFLPRWGQLNMQRRANTRPCSELKNVNLLTCLWWSQRGASLLVEDGTGWESASSWLDGSCVCMCAFGMQWSDYRNALRSWQGR